MPTITAYPDATLSGVFQQTTPSSTEATLHEAVDSEDNATYVDFLDPVFTSGNCYEVLELDLSALPAGAVVTAVTVEFRHQRNRQGGLKVTSAAITADGDVVEGVAEQASYGNWNVFIDVTRPTRYELKSGALWSSYDRIGLILQHLNGSTSDSGFHRMYYARAVIEYDVDATPTATATAPTGNITEMGATAWTYSHGDGRVQTHYRVKVTDAAATDPDLVSALIDSGKIQSTNGRSYDAGVPLASGDYKAWVKVWSTSSSGVPTESAWDDISFTIDVPAEPVVAPLSVDAVYDPETASVRVEVNPLELGAGSYSIERSAGGNAFEVIGEVVDAGRDANLLRFDAGALAYVSTPGVFQDGVGGGLFTMTGRIRRAAGRNQLVACVKDWDPAVERGAALAALADSFYDTRYRDGSGDVLCRNGSGRVATRVNTLFLDHIGEHFGWFPDDDGTNRATPSAYRIDSTSTSITLKARVEYRGDGQRMEPIGGNSGRLYLLLNDSGTMVASVRATTLTAFTGGTTAAVPGLVAGDTVDMEATLDLAGGSIEYRYAINSGESPDNVTTTLLENVSVSPDTLNSLMDSTAVLFGKINVTGTLYGCKLFYAAVIPNVGGSCEFFPARDAAIGDGEFTDATSGELVTFSVSAEGKKAALITAPVDLLDTDLTGASSTYWQLEASETPTFTRTSGKDCRFFMYRNHAEAAESGRLFSSESSAWDGYTLRRASTGTAMVINIGSQSTDRLQATCQQVAAGELMAAMGRIDEGEADMWTMEGLSSQLTILDEVVLAEPSHGIPRLGCTGYNQGASAFDDELYAYLNFQTYGPLTDAEASDLFAFLKADRRFSPYGPKTYLAVRADGRFEAQAEMSTGLLRAITTVVPSGYDVDGIPIWLRSSLYPNSGQFGAFHAMGDSHDQVYRIEDFESGYSGYTDSTPSATSIDTAASVTGDLVFGPAADPGADLDVFYVAQEYNNGEAIELSMETELEDPVEALASITAEDGSVWSLSDAYADTDADPAIEPVVTAPDAVFIDRSHPFEQTLVYRARSISDGAPPSAYVNSVAVDTPTDRWWLLDEDDADLAYVPDVVSVDRTEVRTSVVTRMKGRVAAATSGGLGNVFQVRIRTSSPEEREALEALMDSGRSFRMVDVLGRQFTVAVADSISFDWIRAAPVGIGSTGIRDFHEIVVPMVEVV